MKDYTLIAQAFNGSARIYVTKTKNMVQKAKNIHDTWPTASAALGRFLTISSIYGLMQKDENTHVTLRVNGNGPVGKMLVETTHNGNVRGTIEQPHVYIVYNNGDKKGKLNVGAAVGLGHIHVTKDLGLKDVFTSSSEIQTGEIAEDFTYFFTLSEQTPSVVSLGVLVDTDNNILESGGFVIQLLPNASEDVIVQIENMLKTLPSITNLYSDNNTPEDILDIISCNTGIILDKREVKYHCGCSKKGFTKGLSTLDVDTLKELRDEDNGAEIVCQFCKKKYNFSAEDLTKIINSKTFV